MFKFLFVTLFSLLLSACSMESGTNIQPEHSSTTQDLSSTSDTLNDDQPIKDTDNNDANSSDGEIMGNNDSATFDNASSVALWEQYTCSACHGKKGNGRFSIDSSLAAADLAAVITDTMPIGSAHLCDKVCGEQLAAWMKAGYPYPTEMNSEVGIPSDQTDSEQNLQPDNNINVTYNSNIAIGKTASQSSLGWEGFAENLIDGDYDSWMHTLSESNPWWQTDLSLEFYIDRINVYSRYNWDSRISNSQILISKKPISHDTVEAALMDTNVQVFPVGEVEGDQTITIQASGRYIRILGPTDGFLNFSELEVYGGVDWFASEAEAGDEDQAYCNDKQAAKSQSLRLLTKREYQNTINDIFAIDELAAVTKDFPTDTGVGGYDNNIHAEVITEARINAFWSATQMISAAVVNNQLDTWTDCTRRDLQCVQSLAETLGYQLFRRPLTQLELGEYSEFIDAGINFSEISENMIKAMLMSPNFLYRHEIGTDIGGNYLLGEFETATLLSYTFLGSTPDAELLFAAKSGLLRTQDQLRTQVERMLKKPQARENIIHFAKQWLEVEEPEALVKDGTYFPDYTQVIGEAMDTEFELFAMDIMLGDDKTVSNLFDADYTYSNNILASYYGLSASSNSFEKVFSTSERGGVLKMGAVMASHALSNSTSPILRGKFVRERIMCQTIPQPPEDTDLTTPLLDPTLPTRERFAAHTEASQCQACHQYMDPIGFALESYDGAGKFRMSEAGMMIDTMGEILGLESISDNSTHAFDGADGLIEILANSENTASCVVDHFVRFSAGVNEGNACTTENTTRRWRESGYSFKQLWLEMVSSKLFLLRQ